jgi:hypothetical protein
MSEQLTLGAVDDLAYVIAWTRKNQEAWQAVIRWAHEDRAAGIAPSTRMYLCILRRPHFAGLLGLRRMGLEPVLVNDHLSGDMARLLNRLYPDLKCPTRDRALRREREAS